MGRPVRRRSCKRCKGTGKLNRYHRHNKKVDGPMGQVTIPDKVACPHCCLHNAPVKQRAIPYQPNEFGTPAEHIQVNCGRCGAWLENRPIIEGGKGKPEQPDSATQAADPTPPHTKRETPASGPHRRGKRRRKLARKARNPSKPGLPSEASHTDAPSPTSSGEKRIRLRYASHWQDTVEATVRWRMTSNTVKGAVNIGVEFDRPLNMANGKGPSKNGTFSIITIMPDGRCHPPWVSIVE